MSRKRRNSSSAKKKNSLVWQLAIGGLVLLIVAIIVIGMGAASPDSGANSRDGSRRAAEAPPPDPEMVARGREIYTQYCLECHGENGVGENPADPSAVDDSGRYLAPPLDASAHAWHHTDEDLIQFISEGSPRNPRMKAWKDVLSRGQIRDVVEYIKSLWGPRERECQGPRHMDPGCFQNP